MKSKEDKDLIDHCSFCDTLNEISIVEWNFPGYTIGYKCLMCGQLTSYSAKLEKSKAEFLLKTWDLDFSKSKIDIRMEKYEQNL